MSAQLKWVKCILLFLLEVTLKKSFGSANEPTVWSFKVRYIFIEARRKLQFVIIQLVALLLNLFQVMFLAFLNVFALSYTLLSQCLFTVCLLLGFQSASSSKSALSSLNPDYKCCSRTLGNKITAQLASWATLLQINHSELILFLHIFSNDMITHFHTYTHRCTCTQQQDSAEWHFRWKWLSACSSLIPIYGCSVSRCPSPFLSVLQSQCGSHSFHFNLFPAKYSQL